MSGSTLDVIFGLINQKQVPLILSSGILIFALLVFMKLRSHLATVQNDLTHALQAFKKYRDSAINFDALSEELKKLHSFAPSWNSLKNTLILGKDDLDGNVTILMPQPVGLHISEPKIIGAAVNLRFYQAMPNMLVGLGLLFTFVGLVMALYFASKGVAQEHDKAVEALQELLNAATFKFLTSLAGLSASLAFSWREKAAFHEIGRRVDFVKTVIESSFKQTSLEAMAVERNKLMIHQRALLKEVLDEAKQQTAQIKRFETDFAVSIASALDNKLSPHFEYVAATLGAAIEHLASKIGTVNEEALRKMIEDFRSTLSEGAGAELGKLASLVTELTETISKSGTTLGENLKNAGDHITGGAELLDDVLTNLKADVVDLGNVVQMATANAEKTTSLLTKNVEDLSSLHGSLGQTLNNLQGIGATINTTATTLDSSINGLIESQKITSSQVEEMLNAATTALAALNQSGTQVQAVANALQTAWKSYQERFEGVDKDLESVFTTINDGLDNYAKRVAEFQSSIDSDLGKAVQSLGGLVGELNDLVEELVERPNNQNKH